MWHSLGMFSTSRGIAGQASVGDTSEDQIQGQEISPYRSNDHSQRKAQQFVDYMSIRRISALASCWDQATRVETHAGTAGVMLLFSPATGLKAAASSFSSRLFSLELFLRLVMVMWCWRLWMRREKSFAGRLNQSGGLNLIRVPLTSCLLRRACRLG
jgi:hypothetical protein